MFRILVIEDIQNVLEELNELLKDNFPDSQIEMCSNVEEGKEKICLAAGGHRSFDIAILDFKLPLRQGENPEINELLCLEIKNTMPGTLVIHITSYHEDPRVTRHVKDYHSDRRDPRVELIPKTAYWPEQLLSEMKAFLYGKQVEQQLDQIFGKPPAVTTSALRKADSSRGSLTHELAALSRDIANYWSDLDNVTKRRIQELFNVVEGEKQVCVSLLEHPRM